MMSRSRCSSCERNNTDENDEDKDGKSKTRVLWIRFLAFVDRHYLVFGLFAFITFGILIPQPGVFMSKFSTHYICVVLIFFLTGLNLKSEEVLAAVRAYRASLWGLLSVLLVTPSIGTQLTALLPFNQKVGNTSLNTVFQTTTTIAPLDILNITVAPLEVLNNATDSIDNKFRSIVGPEDFRIGLQIFLCCPSTMSSCVVMCTQAGGNYALALLISIATNVLGVFVCPFMITWLTGLSSSIKMLAVGRIVLNLFLTMLLPIAVGKVVVRWKKINYMTFTYRKVIRLISLTALMILPWMKVSNASMDNTFSMVATENIAIIAVWGAAIHISFLVVNAVVGRWILRLDIKASKSIVLLASQKNLSLPIILISYLPESVGNQGLMVIAVLTAYITQIVIDVVVTSLLSRLKNESEENNKDTNQNTTVNLGDVHVTVF